MFGEHLLSEVVRVYPDTGLEARIERGILRAEPRLPTGCISQRYFSLLSEAADESPGRPSA